MIKECPVILNNDAVTVVKFDGIDIQLPAIHTDAKSVYVEAVDGKYAVTAHAEKSEEIDAKIIIDEAKQEESEFTLEESPIENIEEKPVKRKKKTMPKQSEEEITEG